MDYCYVFRGCKVIELGKGTVIFQPLDEDDGKDKWSDLTKDRRLEDVVKFLLSLRTKDVRVCEGGGRRLWKLLPKNLEDLNSTP